MPGWAMERKTRGYEARRQISPQPRGFSFLYPTVNYSRNAGEINFQQKINKSREKCNGTNSNNYNTTCTTNTCVVKNMLTHYCSLPLTTTVDRPVSLLVRTKSVSNTEAQRRRNSPNNNTTAACRTQLTDPPRLQQQAQHTPWSMFTNNALPF